MIHQLLEPLAPAEIMVVVVGAAAEAENRLQAEQQAQEAMAVCLGAAVAAVVDVNQAPGEPGA